MRALDRGVIRQACACWISADPEAMYLVNRVACFDRRALYWRARSVVVHDRALRLIDSDPNWLATSSIPSQGTEPNKGN